MRIAVAGFQHETNTFAPSKAGIEEFRMPDSWPGLLTGESVVAATKGMNLPIAGAVAAPGEADLVPLLWCAAEPSGPVTDEAFDWVAGMILDGLAAAGRLDGIYLDLHGAMVTESHEDGEGALLGRIRELVGPDLPIGVSLDMHANISPGFVTDATVITVYRTYPHLDMAETGARCMHHLKRAIRGARYVAAFRQAGFLVPLPAQYTGQEPAKGLYQRVERLSRGDGASVDMALGFTAADVPDCGPSVMAYGESVEEANALADTMSAALTAAAPDFDAPLYEADEAVRRAMAVTSDKPVVIADVQDNPGAGGTADTTGLLQALIHTGAQGAVLGVLCDVDVAGQAHQEGLGAVIEAALGAKSGLPGHSPVVGRYRVLALSDGQIPCTGVMYGRNTAMLGPSCLLALETPGADICVVVSSRRIQCLDQALFRHFGVDLETARIICVKSTVHYRADFEALSVVFLNAVAPGAFPCRLSRSDYRRVREGVKV